MKTLQNITAKVEPPKPAQVLRRPRCQHCGSLDVEAYSRRRRRDGTQIRYYRCRRCPRNENGAAVTFVVLVI